MRNNSIYRISFYPPYTCPVFLWRKRRYGIPRESAGAGIKQKKLLDADGNPGVFVQSQGGGL